MTLHFDNFAKEGNAFLNELAEKLGHTGEQDREHVGRILRAVMHGLRDCLNQEENLHVIAQLPMALKAVYVDQWKNRATPLRPKDMEEFTEIVNSYQQKYGERNFDWNMDTEEIIKNTLMCLRQYISTGEAIHIMDQLPKEVKAVMV